MDPKEMVDIRQCIGCPSPLPSNASPQRRYCSVACRQRAKDRRRKNRGATKNQARPFRRPLPVVARDSAWTLRRDIERVERIFADERFARNKHQVVAHLRDHLKYAAEVCQDLLSRLDKMGD